MSHNWVRAVVTAMIRWLYVTLLRSCCRISPTFGVGTRAVAAQLKFPTVSRISSLLLTVNMQPQDERSGMYISTNSPRHVQSLAICLPVRDADELARQMTNKTDLGAVQNQRS